VAEPAGVEQLPSSSVADYRGLVRRSSNDELA